MKKALTFVVVLALLVVAVPWVFRHPDISRATLEARYGRPPSRFLALPGGARGHVRDRGPRGAPTLLLIHGSTDSLVTWEPWVSRLSDAFRIVTLDLPGHGLTGAVPDGDYSEDAMVTFVTRVADALRLNGFAIGGNSMGARIAARFVEEHPEPVTHLILVDSGGLGRRGSAVVEAGFRVMSKPVLANPLLNLAPRWLARSAAGLAVSRKAVLTDARMDAFWDLNHMEGTREATVRRFSTGASRIREHLHGITVPTLILWGEDDRVVPVTAAREFHDAIAGSRLIVYPGTGHLPQEEVADQSASDVRAFLTGAE